MIKVYVMATCPDCTQVKAEAANDARFELIDLGLHVRNLKAFLHLRDSHPAFDKVKARGNIGLPCFVMEDGSIDFSWERVKQRIAWTPLEHEASDASSNDGGLAQDGSLANDGAACSLDGGSAKDGSLANDGAICSLDGAACSLDGKGC